MWFQNNQKKPERYPTLQMSWNSPLTDHFEFHLSAEERESTWYLITVTKWKIMYAKNGFVLKYGNFLDLNSYVKWHNTGTECSSGGYSGYGIQMHWIISNGNSRYSVFFLNYSWPHLEILTMCVFYRVSTVCNSMKGPSSDARAFTTHSAPPDTPLPPRLSHRTKSSLTLQWKVCMTEMHWILYYCAKFLQPLKFEVS